MNGEPTFKDVAAQVLFDVQYEAALDAFGGLEYVVGPLAVIDKIRDAVLEGLKDLLIDLGTNLTGIDREAGKHFLSMHRVARL